MGNVVFPMGKMVFSIENAVIPIGKMVFPMGNAVFPMGKMIFPEEEENKRYKKEQNTHHSINKKIIFAFVGVLHQRTIY